MQFKLYYNAAQAYFKKTKILHYEYSVRETTYSEIS